MAQTLISISIGAVSGPAHPISSHLWMRHWGGHIPPLGAWVFSVNVDCTEAVVQRICLFTAGDTTLIECECTIPNTEHTSYLDTLVEKLRAEGWKPDTEMFEQTAEGMHFDRPITDEAATQSEPLVVRTREDVEAEILAAGGRPPSWPIEKYIDVQAKRFARQCKEAADNGFGSAVGIATTAMYWQGVLSSLYAMELGVAQAFDRTMTKLIVKDDAEQQTYEFSLRITGSTDLTDDVVNRLHKAGCDDATIAMVGNTLILDFDRAAESMSAARTSALRDVQTAGIGVATITVMSKSEATGEDRTEVHYPNQEEPK